MKGTITVYGIHNCDTVKKARKWLDEQSVTYRFHDLRKEGINEDQIHIWMQQLHWENLVNKSSTSWRQLDEHNKKNLNKTTCASLLLKYPTLIKRPVLTIGNRSYLGFSVNLYQQIFNR